MKYAIPVPVFVMALLVGQLSCDAQLPVVPNAGSNNVQPNTDSPNALIPSRNSLLKYSPKRTGDTEMPAGAFNGFAHTQPAPDLGAPGSAGNGFHHFPLPFDKYTTWYRPRAATLTQYQRCEPDSFRPRGFGNLFARPCDGFRMEYEPYSVGNENSKYGPAYIGQMPDQRCDDHCKHCGLGRGQCDCK